MLIKTFQLVANFRYHSLSCYSITLTFDQFIMDIPGTNTIPSMSIFSEYQGSSGANHCPMTAHEA